MSARRSKIDRARERHELARLALETKRINRVLARYDAVEPSKSRRQPVREYQDESGVYDMTRRLSGCNLGRDLERNYSPARGILHQMRVNVVGSQGKLRVNTDAGGGDASDWFNEVWAKDCDFRDDNDWSTILQNILASMLREGDALCVVDDDLVEDSGKLLTWESDQIAPLSEAALAASPFPKARQDNGILRDDWGRVLGYVTTRKRGLPVVDNIADATVWGRDAARLARNPWRLNQGRGVPSIITPASNYVDLYEILAGELATAKRAAKQYAYVRRKDAVTDWDNPAGSPEFLPENDGRTSTDVAADGANQTTHTAKNYEKIEAMTGGLTDYIAPEDEVVIPDINRPNANLAAFLDSVNGMGGAALGMAMAYTRLRADSSYTAFRGDMILSWQTFRWLQKALERRVADWVAVKVLGWAQRKKLIPALPAGWQQALSWTWPTMPAVDELKESNAVAQTLKNGTTTYSELLGPDWARRFAQLSTELDTARDLGIPLSAFETASGGSAEPAQTNNGAPENDEGKNE